MSMKDYSKLTNEELFNELDNLHMCLEQDDAMDGSGELGGIIYEGYEPFFDAVYAEMNKRGLSSDSLIGRTATVETGYYEYRTGTITHVREAETEIDLGNGISGTEKYPVVTIVDKDGKEHIGQFRNISKAMKHYVTFGQVHVHRVQGKTLDRDTVAVYEAESREEGRKKAFDLFGNKFFTVYHGDEWIERELLPFFPKGYVYLK